MKSKKIKSMIMKAVYAIFVGTTSISLVSPTLNVLAYEEEKTTINEVDIFNRLVDEGYLIADESTQTVKITEKYQEAVLSNLSTNERVIFTDNSITIVPSVSTRASTGVNKFVWTWKDFDVYLDHNIGSIVVNGGSVATALAAFIPDPTVSKVVAVALAAASSLIAYNDHGKGVIVAFLVIPGQTPVPHWISSQ